MRPRIRFTETGPLAILSDALEREWAQCDAIIVVEADAAPARPFELIGTTAIVRVEGPLVRDGGWFWDGYDAIQQRFSCAIEDPCVERVVLKIDSPGGVVSGMLECVHAMRAMATASGKHVTAFADEMACSAAYAIACVADEIVTTETGALGSVGVIAKAVSVAEHHKSEGIDVRLITSGAQKADLNPAAPLSEGALDRLQARVDTLAGMFEGWVAAARGMTTEAVKNLEAGVKYGRDAVAANLGDRISSWSALVESLAASPNTNTRSAAPAPPQSSMTATVGRTGVKMDPETLAMLGLSADASPADIQAAIGKMTRANTAAAAAATAASATEAAQQAGRLEALRVKAERAEALEAELAQHRADKAAQVAAARTARIDAAVAAGKLSPAQKERFVALSAESLDAALSVIEESPPVVNGERITEDSGSVRAANANASADRQVAEQMGIPLAKLISQRANHTPGLAERQLASVADLSKPAVGGVR